jgi:hypothetical protein
MATRILIHQNSHPSSQCKVMISQPQNFTAEMRRATDPDHPPGGSRAVREKLPGTASSATVLATGYMITRKEDSPPPPTLPSSAGRTTTPAQPRTALDLPPLQPRPAWMREGDDHSDEQADADWHVAVSHLLGSREPVPPTLGEPTPSSAAQGSSTAASQQARRSFFDEEYVAGRRVPSPTSSGAEKGSLPPIHDRNEESPNPKKRREPPAKIARLRDNIERAIARPDGADARLSRVPDPITPNSTLASTQQ